MKQSKIGAKMQCVSFSLDNWETVFYICHSVWHLSRAGKEVSTGTFLWHELFQESSLFWNNTQLFPRCACTAPVRKEQRRFSREASTWQKCTFTLHCNFTVYEAKLMVTTGDGDQRTFLDILTLSSKQLTENQGKRRWCPKHNVDCRDNPVY